MSLSINVMLISDVLLGDGWHKVAAQSFMLDVYEFVQSSPDPAEAPLTIFVGDATQGHIGRMGATWREQGGTWVACPLTAVLAVRYSNPSGHV